MKKLPGTDAISEK